MSDSASAAASETDGVRTRASPHGYDATLDRLRAEIDESGLRLFATFDHDGAAREVGLELRPSRVIVFGSPAAGTPLMVEAPLLALQLPLRILVWESEGGGTMLSYLTTEALTAPIGLDPAHATALAGVAALVERALARP